MGMMLHESTQLSLSAPLQREVADQIGNTPLFEIRRLLPPSRVRILAKLEWFNPGGSVKDRAAYSIIRQAETDRKLTPQKTILDATSGNTGIALAMLGASRGYPVKLAIPSNASPERLQILRAFGADLVLTDPLEGSDGAIQRARQIWREEPDRYFYADQYSNEANWRAHYLTTGPEILSQTNGQITHFVGGLGTSGTVMGISRRLKEYNPEIVCVSVMPDSPLHGIEGLKHMPSSLKPGIYDPSVVDRNLQISTEEAEEMTRQLARCEGLLVGISAGAALAASARLASELEEGVIVTVFSDGGGKYLSSGLWER